MFLRNSCYRRDGSSRLRQRRVVLRQARQVGTVGAEVPILPFRQRGKRRLGKEGYDFRITLTL